MPPDPKLGRSLVTRRAIRDVVRRAVLTTYGVSGFSAGGPPSRLLRRLGLVQPGLRVGIAEALDIELDLDVAHGLPIAEVARQVDASVRYALADALGREPDRIAIRVGHLRHDPGRAPQRPPTDAQPGTADLAASGTDVA